MAGLALPEGVDVAIDGQDPILPSPHYLGNGAAVARLLTGVAAHELWRLRTGRTQHVQVDARHAAAALRSYMHLDFADAHKRPAMNRGGRGPRVLGIVP